MDVSIRHCAAGHPLRVLIASGGDDQALGVMTLIVESRRSGRELLAAVQGSAMLANAHSSAIKVADNLSLTKTALLST